MVAVLMVDGEKMLITNIEVPATLRTDEAVDF